MTIRKLYTTLLLLIISQGLVRSQNHTEHIKDLIFQLSTSYNVDIAYATDIIKEATDVSEARFDPSLPIEKNLEFLFGHSSLSYYVVNDSKILLKLRSDLEATTPSHLSLSGFTRDHSSRAPLPYASLFIEGTSIGTISNDAGYFSLENLPEGTDTITISYLGYKRKKISVDDFNADQEIYLEIDHSILQEVTIVVSPQTIHHNAIDGHINLNNHQFMEVAAVDIYGSDLFRSIQTLSGVNATLDRGGEIRLRGSAPEETLIVLDGIKLYNVDHYYGIFSSINPEFVSEVNLYKNNVPVQYESRIGGMVDMRSVDKIEKTTGNLEVDFMKARLNSMVKISDKVGINIGARINHTDPSSTPLSDQVTDLELSSTIIENLVDRRSQLIEATPSFNFQDYNFSVHISPIKAWDIRLNGIYSRDRFNNDYENTIKIAKTNGRSFFDEVFSSDEKWSNAGASLQSLYRLNEKNHLQFSLSQSYSDTDINTHVGIVRNRVNGTTNEFAYTQDVENRVENTSGKLEWKSQKSLLGVEISATDNDFLFDENTNKKLTRNQFYNEYSFFLSHDIVSTERAFISLNGRTTYNDQINNTTFNPSVFINYNFNDAISIKGSAATMNQNLRQVSFENRLGQFRNMYVLADQDIIPQGSSHMYMLGMSYKQNNWSLDVESYLKNQAGTIGFYPDDIGIDVIDVTPNGSGNYSIYSGTTRIIGADVSITYDNGPFFSMLNYTLSKSDDEFQELFRGSSFPSQYDRRHQLKWMVGYRVGSFHLSSGFFFASGRPYTSFEKFTEAISRANVSVEDAFRYLEPYARIDLSAQYDFNFSSKTIYLRASVYNITDRLNVRYIQQTFSASALDIVQNNSLVLGSEAALIGRLFNLSAGFSF